MKFRAYLRAAHFGPTMLITLISFALAIKLWWAGPALLISFTVFLGQLIIGWSNDVFDYADDLKHNRINKPLVAGTISMHQLRTATFILLPVALVANLIGPLGIRGGGVYLLGVGCGIAYNFYFKFSKLSPLPYALACAALPASIFLATNHTPPLWVLAVGSMLGVAFHFANVLKDLSQDRESSIGGLPQRLGKSFSIAIITILLILTTVVLVRSPVAHDLAPSQTEGLTSFVVGGDRPVTAILPTGYSKDIPAPLLIDLHGYTGTGLSEESYTKLAAAAEKRTVIYAAPDGLLDSQGAQFWNASMACCNFDNSLVNDVAYIQSVIDQISSKASVDSKRIYLFGHSNGHFMTYKFACEHPKTVAAIAGLAGSMDAEADSCRSRTPVNILHIHGTSDETINYGGGSIFQKPFIGAVESATRWAVINKCAPAPITGPAFDLLTSIEGSETIPTSYSCPKSTVELWSITGGVHVPVLDLNFGLSVLDWLLAHPKRNPTTW